MRKDPGGNLGSSTPSEGWLWQVTILSAVFHILDSERKDKAYHKAKGKGSGSSNKYMISIMASEW